MVHRLLNVNVIIRNTNDVITATYMSMFSFSVYVDSLLL
jgi:hypothetical protein